MGVLTYYCLSMESIRLGGPAQGIVTQNCNTKLCQGWVGSRRWVQSKGWWGSRGWVGVQGLGRGVRGGGGPGGRVVGV